MALPSLPASPDTTDRFLRRPRPRGMAGSGRPSRAGPGPAATPPVPAAVRQDSAIARPSSATRQVCQTRPRTTSPRSKGSPGVALDERSAPEDFCPSRARCHCRALPMVTTQWGEVRHRHSTAHRQVREPGADLNPRGRQHRRPRRPTPVARRSRLHIINRPELKLFPRRCPDASSLSQPIS